MLPDEVDRLVDPGYQDIETGYFRLPNGHMHVRAYTRMPRATGAMVDWWFGWMETADHYRMWEPGAHLSHEWDEHWRKGHYVGASHLVEERMGPQVLKIRIRFHDPAEYFDTSRFAEAGVTAAVCGNAERPDGSPDGRVIHLMRDTPFGSEMRSRFWLYDVPDVAGQGVMAHCLTEMGNMADFLPDLYARETGSAPWTPAR